MAQFENRMPSSFLYKIAQRSIGLYFEVEPQDQLCKTVPQERCDCFLKDRCRFFSRQFYWEDLSLVEASADCCLSSGS